MVECPSRTRFPCVPPGVPGWLTPLILRWSLIRCRNVEKRALARCTPASVGRNRVCATDGLPSKPLVA